MASKMIQDTLTGLSTILGRNIGIIEGGESWFTSSPTELLDVMDNIQALLNETEEKVLSVAGYTFMPFDEGVAIACAEGTDEEARKACEIIGVSLRNYRQLYHDKFDRNNFIKNLLSDNILPNEVIMRSHELQFDMECSNVVMIIRSSLQSGYSPIEILHALFPNRDEDYIIQMDEHEIALVKSVGEDYTLKDGQEIAEKIMSAIHEDALSSVTIGVGSRVDNIRNLAKSYKDANVALEVGKVFDSDKGIIHYENLGIGRLIYQLPTTLCELFLSEIFKIGSLDSLDRETLHTIQKFFENNLNISEASRQLYVHRNTLVYRLDKVQKLTGLDLRIFDHAIVFKVALMVKKYLDSKPMKL